MKGEQEHIDFKNKVRNRPVRKEEKQRKIKVTSSLPGSINWLPTDVLYLP